MNDVDYEIKLTYSNLCAAMVRNVNNNFRNISFDILNNKDVQVKVILYNKSEADQELIDDLISEFSSMGITNNVLKPIISTDIKENYLRYLIYQSSSF
jgi:hypothetical protein